MISIETKIDIIEIDGIPTQPINGPKAIIKPDWMNPNYITLEVIGDNVNGTRLTLNKHEILKAIAAINQIQY